MGIHKVYLHLTAQILRTHPSYERRQGMFTRPERKRSSWILLVLLVPFIVMLWPPFYNFQNPEFIGIPFFYWFQLLWIIITAIIMAVVYFLGV